MRRSVLSLALFAAGSATCGWASEAEKATNPRKDDPAASAAFKVRGDEVEAEFEADRARLLDFFNTLRARVEAVAPELQAKLRDAAPSAVRTGYQVLPRLIPDPQPAPEPSKAVSVSYSWPRTAGFISRDRRTLDDLAAKLRSVAGTVAAHTDDAKTLESLIQTYHQLSTNQVLTDSHIKHNRFWQAEIHANRERYDEGTSFHDAVLARQQIAERLGDDAEAPEKSALVEHEAELSARIRERSARAEPRMPIRIAKPSEGAWTLSVPIITDVQDGAFVEAFRCAVESVWNVETETGDFRIVLELKRVSTDHLYSAGFVRGDDDPRGRAEPSMPVPGQPIDVSAHAARFPSDAAFLTTGASITHVVGRGIFLGPQDIGPNVLAHEFGHLLGFTDGYFRGFRDLGDDGYEILEIVADGEDIMSAPGGGRVGRHHFDKLIEVLNERSQGPDRGLP